MLISCAVTRGVYLALMKNTTSDALKLELRKFFARKGAPSIVISDNARTFKKTSDWIENLSKGTDVQELLQRHEMQWKFNIPLSPWRGGFYERMVAILKACLKKTLGNARLQFNELEVILCEIEASMNNRPITYQGEDIQRALTPPDLINGEILPQIAEESVESDFKESSNVAKRYRYICKKREDLWNRWHRECLVTFRQYHKMNEKTGREVTEGEVVLVLSNNHRSKWKLGVVESLIKSHDGTVKRARVRVIVKEKPKIMERSVQHLHPLEIRTEKVT